MFRFFRATSIKVMTSERNSSAEVVFDSNLFKRVRLLVLTQNSKTPRAQIERTSPAKLLNTPPLICTRIASIVFSQSLSLILLTLGS